MQISPWAAAALALILSSCSGERETETGEVEAARLETSAATTALPAAAWDHKPQAERWTGAVLAALDGPGAPLVDEVPADADAFCPAFADASRADRKAFWVGFLSALAEKEGTWQPEVSGGGGRWHGLLQISPATAEGYGCAADSAEALKSGPANLRCAVRIMGTTVARDGVIAEGGGGVAADWGPLQRAAPTADIAAFTRSQDYCRAG
ncbi:MAG: lytic transglycosylase [Paracoccaceae bacterium]|nr:lytic transglycosylase [Paracoccaceae bacterium]